LQRESQIREKNEDPGRYSSAGQGHQGPAQTRSFQKLRQPSTQTVPTNPIGSRCGGLALTGANSSPIMRIQAFRSHPLPDCKAAAHFGRDREKLQYLELGFKQASQFVPINPPT
jgi:hypothetical protein